jgi:chemotaxis protein MotB
MQQSGLRADQVSQVRGYADQKLRDPKNPLDPSNRRISVIVHYLDAKPGEAEKGDNSSPEEIKEKAEAAASKEKK